MYKKQHSRVLGWSVKKPELVYVHNFLFVLPYASFHLILIKEGFTTGKDADVENG